MNIAADQQDTLPEGSKVMHAERYPLQHLDLIVQPLADTVGSAVFPAVLDVGAPVLYRIGGRAEFRHFGGQGIVDPSGEVSAF